MNTNTTEQSAQQLIDILVEQQSLYEKLTTLSEQQRTMVQSSDAENLLGVLAARQKVIDQLMKLNQAIAPFRENWSAIQQIMSPDQRENVQKLVNKVEGMLADIIKRDEQDRTKLASAREEAGGQLQRAGKAVAAVNAYRARPNNPAARYTNQQG